MSSNKVFNAESKKASQKFIIKFDKMNFEMKNALFLRIKSAFKNHIIHQNQRKILIKEDFNRTQKI